MWDLPKSGLELVSLALQGRFSTTGLPGKPQHLLSKSFQLCHFSGYVESYFIFLMTNDVQHFFKALLLLFIR